MTNAADAIAAVDAGADALGWNLYVNSRRFVPFERAVDMAREMPNHIVNVAVTVNPTLEEALGIAASGAFAALQLHGRETPEFCRRLVDEGVSFAKAVPVTNSRLGAPDLSQFVTSTIVLDSAHPKEFGGSGRTFPWEIAAELHDRFPEIRLVLAGGLTPENVAEAVRIVRPAGVDVTTGVETAPGRKDQTRIRAFVAAVRAA